MSFDENGLQLQFQGHHPTGGNGVVSYYGYITNDAIETILADGYFDGALANGLAAHDNIRVFADNDGNPEIYDLMVTVGGADVTVVAGLAVSAAAGNKIMARIDFGATELGGSETNTSFTFPGAAVITDAYIYVSDNEAGGTMDVGTQGTSNDPDGILDGISLANTGFVFPDNVITSGLNEDYISATVFGALWNDIQLGTDVAGNTGYVTPAKSLITAADPVSITSSGDLNSCSGTLFIEYILLPDMS